MNAVTELAPIVGVRAACDSLAVARASFYRHRPLLGPEPATAAENAPPPEPEVVPAMRTSARALTAPERWICQDDVETVIVLDIRQVLRERVGVNNVGSLDPMQNHVHNGNYVWKRLFLLSVKSFFLQNFIFFGRTVFILFF